MSADVRVGIGISPSDTASSSDADAVPFASFILKVASRCNLNCSYCFVYNTGDESWRTQPVFMSTDTVRKTCERIGEHVARHQQREVHIILHGGEPLLLGARRLRATLSAIDETLKRHQVRYRLGMQTNATLFTAEIGAICREFRASVGVSLDGPPKLNDLRRVDHHGHGSGASAELGLNLLTQNFPELFGGFLAVVDIRSDPVEVLEYLSSFNPGTIDFLLPYDNWDRLPPGKTNPQDSIYGEWLIRAFDHWIHMNHKVRIRLFESYIRCMVGARSLVESVGIEPVDLVVVETNGGIEAVDSLKASFNGAPQLGLNVFSNDFDVAAEHANVRMRQVGTTTLCGECQRCELVTVCGGGYLPNRYSKSNGFANPTIYCADLKLLLPHIRSTLTSQIRAASAH